MANGGGKAFWIVPAGTFLVGLLLGGLFVGIGTTTGPSEQPSTETAAPAEPTPETSPSEPDTTVTVPAECVAAAQFSSDIVDLGERASQALTQLDARELTEIVGQLEDLDPQVREAAQACRDAAGGATPSPTG